MTPEGKAGLLNCSAQEEAFLNEGATYSALDYPQLNGDGDNPIDALSPAYVYFTQFPNAIDANLGVVGASSIGACQALGEAISSLGINSSNYRLARVVINDGEINTANSVEQPSWVFYFAQVYQGYWLDVDTATGFSSSAEVYSNTGVARASSPFPLNLPPNDNISLSVSYAQALQMIKHATMNIGPGYVANGTVDSVDLRVAQVYRVPSGTHATIQPLNGTTSVVNLRLLWIITTSVPNFVGYFVVDAVSGQIVEAEGEDTRPCGGSPNCGIVYSTPSGVYSSPLYSRVSGAQVTTQRFLINGTAVGLDGEYPVAVPNVLVMRPGSQASVGLVLTGLGSPCNQTGNSGDSTGGPAQTRSTSTVTVTETYCGPYQISPLAVSVPENLSVTFARPDVSVPMGGNATDTMLISAPNNAAQGTYIVFLRSPPSTASYSYFILSIWDGQGEWPVLPMMNAPLLDGQDQPILVNGASIFQTTATYTPTNTASNLGTIGLPGITPVAVAVDQTRNLVFTEEGYHDSGGGGIGISVISAANDTVLHTIPIYNASFPATPTTMAFDSTDNLLFVPTANGQGQLVVVDMAAMKVVGSVPFRGVEAAAYDPNTNLVYACGDNVGLTVFEAASRQVTGHLQSGGVAIAVNPVTNMVYMANENGTVAVINGDTNTVMTRVVVGLSPVALAVNSKTNTIYVANFQSNSVSIIYGADNHVVSTPVQVGKGPYGLVVNPNNDRVYVADSDSDSVIVFDGSTGMVIEAVPGGPGPIGIDVDLSTGRVYVSDWDSVSQLSVIAP